jgi:hypothetical protein
MGNQLFTDNCLWSLYMATLILIGTFEGSETDRIKIINTPAVDGEKRIIFARLE